MSLLDSVIANGIYPTDGSASEKKRYAETLSQKLAWDVADLLRLKGFKTTKPTRGGKGEKAFQGGLGPKRVDVSYADERHGLLLAVSIKTICAPPYGKNLKNRFGDFLTEAITLHMRFPYAVVCALLAFPIESDQDTTRIRKKSTFKRASELCKTASGRKEHTNPPEKFEQFATMLFQPVTADSALAPWVKLIDCDSQKVMTEDEYFERLRLLYNERNPHNAYFGQIEHFVRRKANGLFGEIDRLPSCA